MYFFCHKQDVGCPGYLETLLHESREAAIKELSMKYSWHYASPGTQRENLPDELWMLAKSKKYDFDIKSGFGGFIVSKEFLDVMHTSAIGFWEIARLHICTKKDSQVTQKEYYFIRQLDNFKQMASTIVDIACSDIYLRKDGTVRQMRALSFLPTAEYDLFMLNDNNEFIFCSEAFRAKLSLQKMKGFELVPTADMSLANVKLI